MPRNPANKRIEVLLSPEQFRALREYCQVEYHGDLSSDVKSSEISCMIRDVLAAWIPSFAEAKPLLRRGKYPRK
jgi:hypothetical protein